MMTLKLIPDTPLTFAIPASDDRKSVTDAFYALAQKEAPLSPRHIKKIEPLIDRFFDALELSGRILLTSDVSRLGALARPDGDAVLLLLIFVHDKAGLRDTLTKMFDIYYYDQFSSALISQEIRTAKDALKEAARALNCDLPDALIPGLDDCPLSVQADIFRLLQPEDLGIRLLESGLMAPINSYTCIYHPKPL